MLASVLSQQAELAEHGEWTGLLTKWLQGHKKQQTKEKWLYDNTLPICQYP